MSNAQDMSKGVKSTPDPQGLRMIQRHPPAPRQGLSSEKWTPFRSSIRRFAQMAARSSRSQRILVRIRGRMLERVMS
jgi:hypothetical protein